jgi:hypothetical protein
MKKNLHLSGNNSKKPRVPLKKRQASEHFFKNFEKAPDFLLKPPFF